MWPSPGADVAGVPAQMWPSPGADVLVTSALLHCRIDELITSLRTTMDVDDIVRKCLMVLQPVPIPPAAQNGSNNSPIDSVPCAARGPESAAMSSCDGVGDRGRHVLDLPGP